MIKKLFLTGSVFAALFSKAQIINPGFETWTNDLAVPSAMNPNAGNGTWGWWDYNFFNSSFVGGSPISVLRSDTAHGGLYSARIESKIYTPTSYNIYQNWGIPFIGHPYLDTLGILFNGNLNETVPTFKPGTACTQKIATYSFWYQYKPNGVDTAECRVLLLNNHNAVAGGWFKTAVATGSTWQQATINMTYVSGLTPDTLYVLYSSSSLDKNPKPGSVLWIDDVSVTLVAGVESYSNSLQVHVYPNPAQNDVTITLANKTQDAKLYLCDVDGRVVLETEFNGETRVNISSVAEGSYVIKIVSDEGISHKKLIIVR